MCVEREREREGENSTKREIGSNVIIILQQFNNSFTTEAKKVGGNKNFSSSAKNDR